MGQQSGEPEPEPSEPADCCQHGWRSDDVRRTMIDTKLPGRFPELPPGRVP